MFCDVYFLLLAAKKIQTGLHYRNDMVEVEASLLSPCNFVTTFTTSQHPCEVCHKLVTVITLSQPCNIFVTPLHIKICRVLSKPNE